MSHGCMNRARLTKEEEHSVTDRLITAFKERPEDFTFTEHTLDDAKTGIEVWISNGRWAVSLWAPVRTPHFRLLNRWRLWHAMHKMRHAHSRTSTAYNAIEAALAKAEKKPATPVTLTVIPKTDGKRPEARTVDWSELAKVEPIRVPAKTA